VLTKGCEERTSEKVYDSIGKQAKVKRPVIMDIDEFILRNADSIWLHQNEMWEYIGQQQCQSEEEKSLNIEEILTNLFKKEARLNFKV
jgi:hypothetical protein